MKYIKRVGIILVLFVCVLYTCSFIWNGIKIEVEQKKIEEEQVRLADKDNYAAQEIMEEAVKETEAETTEENNEEFSDADAWKKIGLIYSGGMQDVVIHESEEIVFQTDWNYHVESVCVTKEFKDSWDEIPDYSEYKLDRKGNFLNEYSYFAISTEIECVQKGIQELDLNNMWLQIYDENGEYIDGAEAWTADLGKSAAKSYFECPLEVGQKMKAEIVYVVPDECLREDYYYAVEVNNQGVTPSGTEDFALIKLPYGVELKK